MGQFKVGSLWAVENEFWVEVKRRYFFAWNKSRKKRHPGIIKYVRKDGLTYQLAPGTSNTQRKGICIFKTSFIENKDSYFLLDLSKPVTEDCLKDFDEGWDEVKDIDEEQIEQLKKQDHFCRNS